MKISFVIPCYRSEHTISDVVAELKQVMAQRPEYAYEIVLVDDCSPDGVWPVIKRLTEENDNIKAIQFTKNFGQQAALLAGMAEITGDAAFCLDDDGQAPVDELFKLVDELEKGYDVVYGRYPKIRQNLFRRFGSLMNRLMRESFLDWPKDILSSSFFICRRVIVDEIIKYDNPYAYMSGLIIRTTRNISDVEVNHRERASGSSGYTFAKLLKLWTNGVTAFSIKPLQGASLCGLFSALIGFVYLLVIVIRKLTHAGITEGYSSIMAVLLIIGGLLMLMLGLIGEYLGRIYICINRSPQYVIRRTTFDSRHAPESGITEGKR